MDREQAIRQEQAVHGDPIEPIDWIELEAGGQILTYEVRGTPANGKDVLVQRCFVVYPDSPGKGRVTEIDGVLSSRWEKTGEKQGKPQNQETPQS